MPCQNGPYLSGIFGWTSSQTTPVCEGSRGRSTFCSDGGQLDQVLCSFHPPPPAGPPRACPRSSEDERFLGFSRGEPLRRGYPAGWYLGQPQHLYFLLLGGRPSPTGRPPPYASCCGQEASVSLLTWPSSSSVGVFRMDIFFLWPSPLPWAPSSGPFGPPGGGSVSSSSFLLRSSTGGGDRFCPHRLPG